MINEVQKCDELYEAGKMVEALAAIEAASDQNDPEVIWRLVRMKFKVVQLKKNAKELEKNIQEGLVTLKAILEKNPECPNINKWYAILLGSKENHESFKAKIEEAFQIREHLRKTIKNNPKDGYAEFILGKWCYQVASVSWYQKKVAATLFASPPEATYEEALEHFEKAEQLKPDIFNTCHLMAAKCLLEMKNTKRAGDYLQQCVDRESRDEESKTNADEARKLAKKNSITLH